MFNSVSSLQPVKKNIVANAVTPVVIDILALASVARKAHWNTRGAQFLPLHELFGELYDTANGRADDLAEYNALLGFPMLGDHIDVSKSSVESLPLATTDGLALCSFLFAAGQKVNAKIDAAKTNLAAIDVNAQQLLIDAGLALGKVLWKIGAHVPQEANGGAP